MIIPTLFALFGCASESGSGEPEPDPFEACSAAEIESLAEKHGYMLVFEACGSNMFQDMSWSTDGHRLYYQLGMVHHVMDASRTKKPVKVVPTPTPVGSTTWVSPTRLVLPLGPAKEGDVEGPAKLAIYDVDTGSVFNVELEDLTEPTDLYPGADPSRVLLSAKHSGTRKVFEVDLSTSEIREPFAWLQDVETFSYTAEGKGVVVGKGGVVTLYDAETGKPRGQWSPAKRGVLHKGGRWLALEHEGEPVSVLQPVGIEELPERERQIALAEAEERANQLPPELPRTVRPPTLSFVDTTTAKRFIVTAIQGSQFEWYESSDYYASFVSWGFERRQFRRNILLGDNARWLAGAEQGRNMLGLKAASDQPPVAPSEEVPPAGEAPEAPPAGEPPAPSP